MGGNFSSSTQLKQKSPSIRYAMTSPKACLEIVNNFHLTALYQLLVAVQVLNETHFRPINFLEDLDVLAGTSPAT